MDIVIGIIALIVMFVALYGWASRDVLQTRHQPGRFERGPRT